jgi:hypothetical protein
MLPGPGGEEILGCGAIEEMTGAAELRFSRRCSLLRRSAQRRPTSRCGGRKVQPGVREIIAAVERETGKQVDLEQPPQSDIKAKALAAVV